MLRRSSVAIIAVFVLLAPVATMAAAKKPVRKKIIVKTTTYLVCPSYQANPATRKYPTLQAAGDAAVKLGAKNVTISLCAGTYDQDFAVASNASFSFKARGAVTIHGSGANPEVFRLDGSGKLAFDHVFIKRDGSASSTATTAIRLESPDPARGSVAYVSANIDGFPQAIAVVNGDLTLDRADVTDNVGGDDSSRTISVQGPSCDKNASNVLFTGNGVSHNAAGVTLALTNVNVKINNSTFDTNTGTQGFIAGSCQRITAAGAAFFMNDAGANPLFAASGSSTLAIRTSSVFRNIDATADDFAQGYDKVSLSQDNVSQNAAPSM